MIGTGGGPGCGSKAVGLLRWVLRCLLYRVLFCLLYRTLYRLALLRHRTQAWSAAWSIEWSRP